MSADGENARHHPIDEVTPEEDGFLGSNGSQEKTKGEQNGTTSGESNLIDLSCEESVEDTGPSLVQKNVNGRDYPRSEQSSFNPAPSTDVESGDYFEASLQNLAIDPREREAADGASTSLQEGTVIPAPHAPAKSLANNYLDKTPQTPQDAQPYQSSVSDPATLNEKIAIPSDDHTSDIEYSEKETMAQDADMAAERESQPEIDSIMTQFTDEAVAPRKDEIMSPRMEIAGTILGHGTQFPPRRSSLEPLRPNQSQTSITGEQETGGAPPVPPKSPPSRVFSPSHPSSPISARTSLPPPEPEPDLPFDFHRFLEQLRHRTADPVAKFLRSFLTEFGKKQWMVHEQVKFIGDFLAFITNKMAQCEVWRDVSDAEFDNAKEGMEKLVMNRLYAQTFSPAIPLPAPPSRSKGKRKEADKALSSGRRGQHQEDVERDDILAQKIRIYSWVREEHLDIPPVGPNGKRYLNLAQQELLKIKGYRAPRDKVICVLNCCKLIFGLLKNSKSSDTSADSFVPLLIYVVLQANPEHLVSNIQYILRFRNQDKLGGEAGYYISSLSGAIQFIESLDRTTLTVSDEEFERNVEKAVSEIAERNNRQSEELHRAALSEKSTLSGPEVTPRNSMDAEYASPRKQNNNRPGTSNTFTDSTTASEDSDAVAGLLRTIQRPLSTIGRIFSDDGPTTSQRGTPPPNSTPRRLSPNVFQPPPRQSLDSEHPSSASESAPNRAQRTTKKLTVEEAAARQASAEAAEAQRLRAQEHRNVVETLYGMFPNLDKDLIDDVVRMKEGRVGLAVDACLALSAGA